MPIETSQQIVHAVRSKHPKPAHTKPVSTQSYSGPFLPDAFSLIIYHPKSGTWKYLNDFMVNLNWSDSVDEAAMSATVTLDNSATAGNEQISDYIAKGAIVRLMYQLPGESWQELQRFNVWNKRNRDQAGNLTCEVQLYDFLQYLKSSYDTFLYHTGNKKKAPWTAYTITKDICQKFAIPFNHLPNYKKMTHIDYIYSEDISIYDFLLKVWTLERKQSKKRFLIRAVKGKLSIIIKKATSRIWELTGAVSPSTRLGGLMSADYSEGFDPGDAHTGTATSVTVRSYKRNAEGEDQRVAVVVRTATNNKLRKQYGLLHKVIDVDHSITSSHADKIARAHLKALQKPFQQAGLAALGIPSLRAGDAVFVNDLDVSLRGRVFCSTVNQTLDGLGSYTMTVDLSFMDVVPELVTDPNDLKPSESGSGESSASDGTEKPAAMPSWLFAVLKKACREVKVPETWASSNALAELLQHESGFSPTAQNPGSTAYGLFQFLDTTWGGQSWAGTAEGTGIGPHISKKTSDPLLQCCAGLLYIKNNAHFSNPEEAWNFWNLQSPHWY